MTVKGIFVVTGFTLAILSTVSAPRVEGQEYPGLFVDATHPSGSAGPAVDANIWKVDPLSGALSVHFEFGTLPTGGRGKHIPYGLNYNSASTLALSQVSTQIVNLGDMILYCYSNTGACISMSSPATSEPTSQWAEVIATYDWQGANYVPSTVLTPTGVWTVSAPGSYQQTLTIPEQDYWFWTSGSGGAREVNLGEGCQLQGPFTYTDINGHAHDTNLKLVLNPGSPPSGPCAGGSHTGAATTDGSGMQTALGTSETGGNGGTAIGDTSLNGETPYVLYPDGSQVYLSNPTQIIDTNGNRSSWDHDSLNRQTVTASSALAPFQTLPTGTFQVTTTGPTGSPETYDITLASQSLGGFTMPHPTKAEITEGVVGGAAYAPTSYVVNEPAGSINGVTLIGLPDTTSYQFEYDSTYGTISKIIYPTGGYTRFVWNVRSVGMWPESFGGNFYELSTVVVTDVYTSTGSGPESHWSYTYPDVTYSQATSSVVAPDGTTTDYIGEPFIYSVLYGNGQTPSWQETSRSVHNSAGELIESVATSYSNRTNVVGQPSNTGLPLQIATTIYDGATPLQKQVQYSYDTWGNVTEKDESDFYGCTESPCSAASTPPSGWLRKTFTVYNYTTNTAWVTAHIVNKPSKVVVTNGSGVPFALTTYTYDEAGHLGSTPTGLSAHDDTNYGSGSTLPRGNLTTEGRCLTISGSGSTATCSSSWNTTYYYDLTGQVTSKVEGAGTSAAATTSYTWAGPMDGFLQEVQYPNGATDSYTYYTPTGEVDTHIDWNNQTTYYYYTDPNSGTADLLNRLRWIKYPATTDGTTGTSANGTTTFTYVDTPGSFSVQEQQLITGSTSTSVTKKYDGFGRLINSSTSVPTSQCSTGNIQVQTAYDLMSRVESVSNPYCSTSDPTYGSTGFEYDALSRKTQTNLPDGSISSTSYGGNATEITDPPNGGTSVQHIQQVDGLGRLTNVCEVAAESLGSSSSSACGLNIAGSGYLTTYGYDPLGNLLAVNQHGLSRSFVSVRARTRWTCFGRSCEAT